MPTLAISTKGIALGYLDYTNSDYLNPVGCSENDNT